MKKSLILAAIAALSLSACVETQTVRFRSFDQVETVTTTTPAVTTVAPVTTFTVEGTGFAVNSDLLRPAATIQLDGVAQSILSIGGSFNVVGYASTEGDDRANQLLSERRARSVAAYLIGRGVPATSLIVIGAGETTQFGPDLASNRRVVISQRTQTAVPVVTTSPIVTTTTPVITSTPGVITTTPRITIAQ